MIHDLIAEIAPQTSLSKLTLQTQMFPESDATIYDWICRQQWNGKSFPSQPKQSKL